MQIQGEHSRIYKQAYSLDIWRQVANFENSNGKAHLFIHGIDNQLNTKSLQNYVLWVWKYQYHQSGSWQTQNVSD